MGFMARPTYHYDAGSIGHACQSVAALHTLPEEESLIRRMQASNPLLLDQLHYSAWPQALKARWPQRNTNEWVHAAEAFFRQGNGNRLDRWGAWHVAATHSFSGPEWWQRRQRYRLFRLGLRNLHGKSLAEQVLAARALHPKISNGTITTGLFGGERRIGSHLSRRQGNQLLTLLARNTDVRIWQLPSLSSLLYEATGSPWRWSVRRQYKRLAAHNLGPGWMARAALKVLPPPSTRSESHIVAPALKAHVLGLRPLPRVAFYLNDFHRMLNSDMGYMLDFDIETNHARRVEGNRRNIWLDRELDWFRVAGLDLLDDPNVTVPRLTPWEAIPFADVFTKAAGHPARNVRAWAARYADAATVAELVKDPDPQVQRCAAVRAMTLLSEQPGPAGSTRTLTPF
jgi:hypothetical protein